MNMNIINTTQIAQTNVIRGRKGQFRTIVKAKAGFMTVRDHAPYWNSVIDVFRSYEGGILEAIEFKAEGTDLWLTVFAKAGKKVRFMDNELFMDIKVADINDGKYWSTTNLYDQKQYSRVNAKSWIDKVFVMNAA